MVVGAALREGPSLAPGGRGTGERAPGRPSPCVRANVALARPIARRTPARDNPRMTEPPFEIDAPFERERTRVVMSLRAAADLVDALPDEELPEALVRLAGGLEAFLVAARAVFRRPLGE